MQLWGACCSGHEDGDIVIGVKSTNGDPLGPDDGLLISVADTQYSPRRLENSMNFAVNAGLQATELDGSSM